MKVPFMAFVAAALFAAKPVSAARDWDPSLLHESLADRSAPQSELVWLEDRLRILDRSGTPPLPHEAAPRQVPGTNLWVRSAFIRRSIADVEMECP